MESFLIAERYVPRAELRNIAETILLAQDIREESWDKNKSIYNKTQSKAAEEAVEKTNIDKFWINVIHGWNHFMWNDSQEWARDIIKKYDKGESNNNLDTHTAYQIATKLEIDGLNYYFKDYPINKENAKGWLTISRTLSSTLNIIDTECKKYLEKGKTHE